MTMTIFSCEHEVSDNLCSPDQAIEKGSNDRWAVILAGGDGTRLQSMTRTITGDDRPKQFVPVIGGSTLLDQTRSRVALSVLPGRTLFVVTDKHRRFYQSLSQS